MKKQILFLLLLATSIVNAQTSKLKVTESNVYKDKVKARSILAIHSTEANLTGIVRNSKKDFLFDIFDEKLNKIFSKVIESSRKEAYVGDVFYGDEMKFFTVFSPTKNERIVYAHVYNLKQKSHKKEALFTANVEKKQRLFARNNKRETSVAISPNGDYFAIATDNIKKNSNSYTIRVFNTKTLKLVYKKAYQEHKERYFQPNDLVIDNSATVYALGKLFIDGRSLKKKGEANYQFVLNKITKDNVKDVTVDLTDDLHIKSLVISKVKNRLNLVGFYSERNVGRIKGGCNFKIDSNALTVLSTNTTNLPIDVYEDLYGYRKAKKKKKKGKELSNFYIDYILQDSKGNTYILAEEFYITYNYVSTGVGGGYSVPVFHYDDILILKADASGNLDWGRSIFKRALAPSYNAFLKNDELHVILNSGKNLTEKKDGRTKVSQGWLESSALYDFVYQSNGEVAYNKIQDNKGKTFYVPYYGNFNNEKFIMSSSGRKKKQFMILE